MNERLQSIIKGAIKEEEHFIKYYSDAAKKTTVPSAKTLFQKLSKQEMMHKVKLKNLDLKSMKVKDEDISKIEVAKDLMLTPISEFKELKKVFKYAIKAEVAARLMYLHLANSVDGPVESKLFSKLAEEEAKHEELLVSQMHRMDLA